MLAARLQPGVHVLGDAVRASTITKESTTHQPVAGARGRAVAAMLAAMGGTKSVGAIASEVHAAHPGAFVPRTIVGTADDPQISRPAATPRRPAGRAPRPSPPPFPQAVGRGALGVSAGVAWGG